MGQGEQEKVATSLAGAVSEEISASLAPVDAELERRYPGDPGTRQPVHTVYVPGDVFAADTIRTWGDRALAALDEHAPDAASFAAVLGLSDKLAEPVHARVRAKLEREPIEDLRVDFEDGYGPRPDAEEDEAAARAARLIAEAYENGTAAPYMGIRMKCMEAPVRDRGIRTLDIFLTGLMEAGGLPDGLVLTLPKVTYAEQVTAMVRLLEAFEKARGLEPGRIGFEIQIETSQSILATDGTATVARMIQAAEGRATGLHYGTFDYSACLGVSAAYQASDHPAADHAKAIMQVAAAGTGVRVSTARRTSSRSAPPRRSTTPGGCTTASPGAPCPAPTTRAGTCTPATSPPATRPSSPSTARASNRPPRGSPATPTTPAATSWTSPPPPRPSAATCCAAWTVARSTSPRWPGRPG